VAELAAYLGIGAVVGFFAGLLGIGGGIIIVSSLALMYTHHGLAPQYVMHLAIGTSLASMLAGSFASLRTHDRHGALDWAVVKAMTPGLLVGVMGGAILARFVPAALLKYFFLGFALLVTSQMVFNVKPEPSRELPRGAALAGAGALIGVFSGLVGGGAAAIGVPFLTWCNVSTHRAIGTVAAMAFPLALAGSIGYVVSGWSAAGLPRWSLGFVYLPALVGISATSMLFAPLGARLAHRLPAPTLRRIFAVFLLAMGAKVAVSV
jgi:uncharacterized membrane protein YfcA